MIRTPRILALLLPFLLVIAVLATACDLLPTSETSSPAVPPAAAPTVTVQPVAATAVAPPSLPAAPLSPLRVWLPPEIGARTASGAEELASQLRAFESTHNGLEIVLEQKPVEGPGGIFSYLRTGRAVAPSVLPDVVAIPTTALTGSGVRELLYPMDQVIDPGSLSDVYPAASALALSDGRLYGYPFATAGLPHLIYRPSVVTSTVSMNWRVFISDTNHTLVLPADSREGALLGLQFYLASGGTLVDENGQPALQVEPLTRALELIALNKANLLQSRQLKTLDEAWQYHQLGLSDFVWTRSDYVLEQLAVDPAGIPPTDQAYSRIPGPGSALPPLTTVWAWAITASDPARQQLAAELIQSLTMPDNLAAWSQRSEMLPARRSAMALLAEESDYYSFASQELERAQAMPVSESSRLLDALGDAVFQVLSTENSPAAIAEEAVAALRQ